MRCVLTEQVYVKHMMRLVFKETKLTRIHEAALVSLLNLATSEYKPVSWTLKSNISNESSSDSNE